jgi:hypothetical protein
MLMAAVSRKDPPKFREGFEGKRACQTCTKISKRGATKPRPCTMLCQEGEEEPYLLFLPVPEDMREGEEWEQTGFWVRKNQSQN